LLRSSWCCKLARETQSSRQEAALASRRESERAPEFKCLPFFWVRIENLWNAGFG
jgi:hypothetical protein